MEEGSEARFLEDVSATNFVVRSVTEDDSDISNDQWDGGCLWNAVSISLRLGSIDRRSFPKIYALPGATLLLSPTFCTSCAYTNYADIFMKHPCVHSSPLSMFECQGNFHADGFVSFSGCDSVDGGESPPGRGGTVFNADTGSIVFQGGVQMEDTFLTVSMSLDVIGA